LPGEKSSPGVHGSPATNKNIANKIVDNNLVGIGPQQLLVGKAAGNYRILSTPAASE
jgi:hypothetical protein